MIMSNQWDIGILYDIHVNKYIYLSIYLLRYNMKIYEIYWGIMDIMISGKMIISNHLSIILPKFTMVNSNITIDQQYYEIHWDIIWLVV